jgi:hypothetical protein
MFAEYLIRRAMKTPYFHLKGYMERYWLVPFVNGGSETAIGCGPVSPWRRPVAWILQKFDIAIRVHHILRSDDDRAFHDHPWAYVTVILKGGYVEVTPEFDGQGQVVGEQRTWRGPGSILRRKANTWHRLEVAEGESVWTLFSTGRKTNGWGFLVDNEKIPYRKYLGLDAQP